MAHGMQIWGCGSRDSAFGRNLLGFIRLRYMLVLSGETTLDVADKADPQPHITADSIEVLGALIREAHSK